MSVTRRALGATAGTFLAVLAAGPAAAQPSVNAELINNLNLDLLLVAVPITVLVEGILIYTIYRFRNNDDPTPTQENRRLEITWTVATAIILLFVGLASYQVLGSPFVGGAVADGPDTEPDVALMNDYPGAVAPTEADALQVEVQAQKYTWTYHYPEEQQLTMSETGEQVAVSNNVTRQSSTGNALVIPANQPVYIHVTSVDWLHSFHVPDLGLKQDAVTGQYNTIKVEANLPEGQSQASYQLYCAEYCGIGHSNMLGTVTVMDQESFAQWAAEQQQSENGGDGNATDESGGNGTDDAGGNATDESVGTVTGDGGGTDSTRIASPTGPAGPGSDTASPDARRAPAAN